MPRMDAAVDSDDRSRPILCPAYQNVIAPAASTITRYSSSALGALLCDVLRFRYDIQGSPARVLKAISRPVSGGEGSRFCGRSPSLRGHRTGLLPSAKRDRSPSLRDTGSVFLPSAKRDRSPSLRDTGSVFLPSAKRDRSPSL